MLYIGLLLLFIIITLLYNFFDCLNSLIYYSVYLTDSYAGWAY